MRKTVPVNPSQEDLMHLEGMANDNNSYVAKRAKIILKCASGLKDTEVAEELGIDRGSVGKWRRKYNSEGIDGLAYVRYGGTPKAEDDSRIDELVRSIISDGKNHTIKSVSETLEKPYRQIQAYTHTSPCGARQCIFLNRGSENRRVRGYGMWKSFICRGLRGVSRARVRKNKQALRGFSPILCCA